MKSPLNENFLEEGLAKLEADRTWSPRVVSRLESFIRSSDDYALYYVNPVKWAREKGISETEAIDLLLHATFHGLFQFHWQLMCPCCGDRVRNFKTLKALDSRFYCNFCQLETNAALDDFIEVSFSIAPAVKQISFHYPEKLPIDDYCFRFRLHPGAQLPGYGVYTDLMKGHVRGMDYIAAGEKRTFEMDLPAGWVATHDFLNGAGFGSAIAGEKDAKTRVINVTFNGKAFSAFPAALCPGKFAITVENQSSSPMAFVLLFFTEAIPTDRLEFEPYLSGKQLLTTQTYHGLFRSDISPEMEGIGVKDITIVFTDLKSSTAMYDRVGDFKAFSLVRQHFHHLDGAINDHNGVLVKTIGDAIMAAYPSPEKALKSAVAMIREIGKFNQTLGGGEEIRLKVGLHRGHSIVVSLNDRLDYFGQTVNVAARVQGLADADEIYLTEEIFSVPAVQEYLAEFEVSSQFARLKGVKDECKVYHFKPLLQAASAMPSTAKKNLRKKSAG